MSIDLNWDTVTAGPDGEDLAHKIRDFIHNKFQDIQLPRFIKSVTVHDFEFGSVPPELELKDITDPLPDFYEENSDDGGDDDDDDDDDDNTEEGEASSETAFQDGDTDVPDGLRVAAERRRKAVAQRKVKGHLQTPPRINLPERGFQDLGSPFLGVSTPGIPGGMSNLHYFPSPFSAGLSGSQTPLAAVASAQHLNNGWMDSAPGHTQSNPNLRAGYMNHVGIKPSRRRHSRQTSQSSVGEPSVHHPGLSRDVGAAGLGIGGGGPPMLREKHSVSTLAPTSVGTSRPPTRDTSGLAESAIAEDDGEEGDDGGGSFGQRGEQQDGRRFREPRVEDIQAVFRIRYAGDIKLLLTTEILLDYPMPSFVGIPVRLSITGLTFDGVGVLANIRKRVHFCFLSPEDAHMAIGRDEETRTEEQTTGGDARAGGSGMPAAKMGGLLQEIRVESEIGQRQSGKQSLKNVCKVERFVLEQVRRIFEEEFVYPSFWTFLV